MDNLVNGYDYKDLNLPKINELDSVDEASSLASNKKK